MSLQLRVLPRRAKKTESFNSFLVRASLSHVNFYYVATLALTTTTTLQAPVVNDQPAEPKKPSAQPSDVNNLRSQEQGCHVNRQMSEGDTKAFDGL